MELQEILFIVSALVSFILGIIAKKNKYVRNELIPLSNLGVGLIMAIIYFIITKDFSSAIAASGLLAGGTYDLGHNLNKLLNERRRG